MLGSRNLDIHEAKGQKIQRKRPEGGNKRSPFYANDATFDGLVGRSAVQLRLLMERGGNH